MEEVTTEPAPAATNQSIEKGVFLTPFKKLVHACKVREDIGAGITRCGMAFLIGNNCYKPSYQFGVPENAGADGTWKCCPKCEAATDYENVKSTWRWSKAVLGRTLKMIGHIKD